MQRPITFSLKGFYTLYIRIYVQSHNVRDTVIRIQELHCQLYIFRSLHEPAEWY